MLGIQHLRQHAIAHSLFPETSLKTAIDRLGFIQADPIRSPARAQDLILRQRVTGYRAGDLERHYTSLSLEEDVLYAYGFIPRHIQQLLHPRRPRNLSRLEKSVLEAVRESGVVHPRALEERFGNQRVVNDWGGYSKGTTRVLEHLHRLGLLRIARRDRGIRLYEAVLPPSERRSPAERLSDLIMVTANILGPVQEKTLLANTAHFGHLGSTRTTVAALVHSGALEKHDIDGISYVWPPAPVAPEETPRLVRFLAPFDPLVWDRRRFEHLWGWPYRFEAYTPPAKRQRGYYAMPLLWHDAVIGWVNARLEGQNLSLEVGFVGKRPRDRVFRTELDAEIDRLKTFLRI
jgi:uncharacterized protein YcaQ